MSTRASLVFAFLDRYASLAIGIGSSMLLARLLTPMEIGVFSVAMILLNYLATIRDFSAGQYVVREQTLTQQKLRAVWAIQLGMGCVLATIVGIASGPVASFYAEPRMRNIMLVLSATYLITPFGSITYAMLVREMRFDLVAIMRFGSTAVGALVSGMLAWQGHGPISLAWGSLASAVTNGFIALFLRSPALPWLPALKGMKDVISFGLHISVSNIAGSIGGSIPEIAISKLQGLAAAGYYSRSIGLLSMFNRIVYDAVSGVTIALFADSFRTHGSSTPLFLKALSYLTAIGWSFFFCLLCLAQPVTRLLYGPQWEPSVDLTRLLAVGMAFSVPIPLCSNALIAKGSVRVNAKLNLAGAGLAPLFGILGAMHGLFTFGLAMVANALVITIIWIKVAKKELGISSSDLLMICRTSGLVALGSSIIPAGLTVSSWLHPESYVVATVVGAIGGTLGFLISIVALRHPLQEELIRLSRMATNRIKRKQPT